MYLTAVLKTFWRLQNVLVELEAAAPMTAFNTWHVHTHLFVAGVFLSQGVSRDINFPT